MLAIAILLAALLALAETALWLVDSLRLGELDAARSRLYAADGIDDRQAFEAEGRRLFATAHAHPYRWFALQPNHRGIWFATDERGFRIDERPGGDTGAGELSVVFFGGSTMFSVNTLQRGSIPAAFERACANPRVRAFNLGMGYHDSTAELMTLIEVVRRRSPAYAVFYDGVNEVGRYLDFIQSGDPGSALFGDVMGHPNSTDYWTEYRLRSLRLTRRLVRLHRRWATRGARERFAELPLEDHARRVLRIYGENRRAIRAVAAEYGISVDFFWQPDIFSTGKALTPLEEQIRTRESAAYRDLSRATHERIRAGAVPGVLDLSGAIDELSGQVFHDAVHLNGLANEAVARAMLRASPSLAGLCS